MQKISFWTHLNIIFIVESSVIYSHIFQGEKTIEGVTPELQPMEVKASSPLVFRSPGVRSSPEVQGSPVAKKKETLKSKEFTFCKYLL